MNPFLSAVLRTKIVKTTALILIACGGIALHAQNTTPLDTAPGANNTNAPAVAAPATPPPAPAPTTPSLLSNGDFELATADPAWPDSWGKTPGISWEKENGKHYLHLVAQEPDKHLMAYREMPIPSGVKGLKITIRYRTAGVVPGKQNWFDARAIFHYLDATRKQVSGDPPVIGFGLDTPAWTEESVNTVVPDGAVTLQLMPSLFMVTSGTLDLAEVRVDALNDSVSTAISDAEAAKAKKAADRAAAIAADLALPPKTSELKVSGNKLVTADGKDAWLQGVNICSLEWSATGDNVLWSTYVATHEWHANAIRLPVMDTWWFGKPHGNQPGNDPVAYQTLVDNIIKLAAANGAYVVLDLHRFLTPDSDCVTFWKDAAARYKNNPAVVFDVFNEPHGTSWEVWQKGGPVPVKQQDGTTQTIQGVGMQGLVDAVRGTGAKNIIVAGGLEYAYDLTGVMKGFALNDKGGNGIMYATHFYNWHRGWAAHFMAVAAKYPVLVGETGGDIHKMGFIPSGDQESPYTWAPDAIGFIQKNHLNWTAWSFHTSATPDLLLDMDNYTPTPFWGQFVKDALGGKQFEMKKER